MKNEERFEIKPEGVRYICENCHKGEMKYEPNPEDMSLDMDIPMYTHRCEACGTVMKLPRVYPYIDWIPLDKKGGKQIGKDSKYSDGE